MNSSTAKLSKDVRKGLQMTETESSSPEEPASDSSPIEDDLLNRSLLSVFRPIARLAINSNIDARRLVETLKVAFVDVATKEYGKRGRPTTTARVSIMSGLTRKEVGSLKEQNLSGRALLDVKRSTCQKLLDTWWNHESFTTRTGQPRELPFSSGTPSFSQLCQEVGGDLAAGAARTELIRAGSVQLLDDKRLRARRRVHATARNHSDFVSGLSDFIAASMISEVLDPDVEELASEAAIVRAIRDKLD